MKKIRGFTVIEVCVVMALIAILSAALLPTLVHSKERAKEGVCLSNLKQIGLAVSLYVGDNDSFLPPYYTGTAQSLTDGTSRGIGRPQLWVESLAHYTRTTEVFWCPLDSFKGSRVRPPQADNESPNDTRWLFTSYQTASILNKKRGPNGTLSLTDYSVDARSEVPYLHDAGYMRKESLRAGQSLFYTSHGDNKTNMLFLDGHVKNQAIDE